MENSHLPHLLQKIWLWLRHQTHLFVCCGLCSIQVSSSIEKTAFKRGSIDYLYFLTVGLALIYTMAIIFKIGYLGSIYEYALFYYFGRINTDRLLIINFIPVRAPYCIWLILTIEWLVGDPALNSSLLGLFIGHCLYFAFNIYQRLGLTR